MYTISINIRYHETLNEGMAEGLKICGGGEEGESTPPGQDRVRERSQITFAFRGG